VDHKTPQLIFLRLSRAGPLNRYRRRGLTEPTVEEIAALMELWEEGRREERKLSLQMRLEIALQILKPLPL
jgi:hypothetical protein